MVTEQGDALTLEGELFQAGVGASFLDLVSQGLPGLCRQTDTVRTTLTGHLTHHTS